MVFSEKGLYHVELMITQLCTKTTRVSLSHFPGWALSSRKKDFCLSSGVSWSRQHSTGHLTESPCVFG